MRAEDLAAELALRRLRRRLFPDLARAFWTGAPPLAITGESAGTTWWSQIAVADGRPLAASGEIADHR